MDFIKKMFQLPFTLRSNIGLVDVRDVAESHIRSLEQPDISNGKRYILVENTYPFAKMVDTLREEFEPKGYSFASFTMPKWPLSFASIFVKNLKNITNEYDKVYKFDNSLV